MLDNRGNTGFNSNFRIGFYSLDNDTIDRITTLLGNDFFEYCDVENEEIDVFKKPDLILTGLNIEQLKELRQACKARVLQLTDKRKDDFGSKTICLDEEDSIKSVLTEAMIANIEKISFLARTVSEQLLLMKQKDMHTYQHLINVSSYATLIGNELGFSKKQINDLAFSGLVYDIGKLCWPDALLFNDTPTLNEDQTFIMRLHPLMGYMLQPLSIPETTKNAILYHHQRLDGSGYPTKGKSIPIEAQLIAVLDSYDAITTKCSYQDSHSHEEAMEILYKLSSKEENKLSREIVKSLDKVLTKRR